MVFTCRSQLMDMLSALRALFLSLFLENKEKKRKRVGGAKNRDGGELSTTGGSCCATDGKTQATDGRHPLKNQGLSTG